MSRAFLSVAIVGMGWNLVETRVSLGAEFIRNGSFEDPVVAIAPPGVFTTPTEWNWSAGDLSAPIVLSGVFDFLNTHYIGAQEGQQWVSIGQTGSGNLSQDIVIQGGVNFRMTWYDNIGLQAPQGTTSHYDVTLVGSETSDIYHGTFNAAESGGGSWNPREVQLPELLADVYTLSFTPHAELSGFATEIDNVSLVGIPETPLLIPESPFSATIAVATLVPVAVPALIHRRKRTRPQSPSNS